MPEYQLICMSFDGEYVRDHKGPIEECRNASADMGSKWYFYPWHLVVTKGLYVKEMYGSIIQMKSPQRPFLDLMFRGRKLSTVQSIFRQLNTWCEKNDITMTSDEFEHELIRTFYGKFVRE